MLTTMNSHYVAGRGDSSTIFKGTHQGTTSSSYDLLAEVSTSVLNSDSACEPGLQHMNLSYIQIITQFKPLAQGLEIKVSLS